MVLVRPESIQVTTSQSEKPGWNTIQGVVETVTFHGAITRLGVNVFGQRVVADVNISNIETLCQARRTRLAL